MIHGEDVLGDEKLIIRVLVWAIRNRWELLEGVDIIEGETTAKERQHLPRVEAAKLQRPQYISGGGGTQAGALIVLGGELKADGDAVVGILRDA